MADRLFLRLAGIDADGARLRGIFEVLVNDEMIQQLIIKRSSAQEITRIASAEGKLRSLKEDAAQKVLQGITTLEEAASAVMV